MPRRDTTGPLGSGSMTGRGLGSCNTNQTNNYNKFIGRGFRNGRRMGNGFGAGLGRFGAGRDQDNIETVDKLSQQLSSLTDQVKKLIDKFSTE